MFFLYDGLGSTRALSDSTGTITDTYDYSAYGTEIDSTGITENSYRYTGEQFDANLNQVYLRARYYDPSSGRFTNMDTWLGNDENPITLNKYLYANIDPVNNIDPSGYFSIGSLMAGISNGARLTTAAVANYSGLAASVVSRAVVNSTLILTRNFVAQANRLANTARSASTAGRRAGRQTINASRAVSRAVQAFKKFSRSNKFRNASGRHYIDLWGPTSVNSSNRAIRGSYRRVTKKISWRRNRQGGGGRAFMIEYKIGLNGVPARGTGFKFRLDYQDFTTSPSTFRPHYHLCYGPSTSCRDHHYLD